MDNSSPIIFNTPEPTVYICTIIPYYINSVGSKVCNYLLLFFKVVILKTRMIYRCGVFYIIEILLSEEVESGQHH